MEQQVPLSLSFDDNCDGSFADDLILQFNLKRERLYTITDTQADNDNQLNDDNDDDLPISTPSLHSNTPALLASVSRTIHFEEDNDHDITPNAEGNSATNVSPTPTRLPNAPQPHPESLSPSHSHKDTPPPATDDVPLPARLAMTPSQHQSPVAPPTQINVSSPPAPPAPTDSQTRQLQRQNHNGLLRRSSTFLRQKFFSAANTPIPSATASKSHPTPASATTTTTTTSTTGQQITDHKTITRLPANQVSESDRTITMESTPTVVNNIAPASSPPSPPCQYPPKPLSYCPVDPPTDDQPRRTSFPTLVPWRKKSTPRRQSEPTVAPLKGRRSFFF